MSGPWAVIGAVSLVASLVALTACGPRPAPTAESTTAVTDVERRLRRAAAGEIDVADLADIGSLVETRIREHWPEWRSTSDAAAGSGVVWFQWSWEITSGPTAEVEIFFRPGLDDLELWPLDEELGARVREVDGEHLHLFSGPWEVRVSGRSSGFASSDHLRQLAAAVSVATLAGS